MNKKGHEKHKILTIKKWLNKIFLIKKFEKNNI